MQRCCSLTHPADTDGVRDPVETMRFWAVAAEVSAFAPSPALQSCPRKLRISVAHKYYSITAVNKRSFKFARRYWFHSNLSNPQNSR